ncbi:serine/threonine-protein phosphatase 2A activator 1 [[Candida] railenensis]|uniref:Serine/threonine-protein phosphatase 2A activator n=1 Tax=[Candida] railenensis TaxID=45579 RepID=A0A9P0QTC5_9ASCO|nr:serine/threonine-protein phosphatase 2A activator 1 [[Candida] railenensis]
MPQGISPSKKIFDSSDLVRFRKSIAYKKIHWILEQVIEKVKGCEVPPGILDVELITKTPRSTPNRGRNTEANTSTTLPPPESVVEDRPASKNANFNGILKILNHLNSLIDETPPKEGPRRFGNLACRIWHDKVNEGLSTIVEENISIPSASIVETSYYLQEAFGSSLRLDFGTGHELSFLAFVGCIDGLVESLTGPELLTIFAKYYNVVRRLILEYNLEPAGSHGVWGLDDHFHLIYILGAAQFNENKNTGKASTGLATPPVSSVLTLRVIDQFKLRNLYVSGIAFIYKIKSGPFNEHSPIIYDIHTTVILWSKVLQGLRKMYEVEVLGKFPVVQHFWFGNIMYPWRDIDTNKDLPVFEKEEEETPLEPDFLNGTGVMTTRKNISMTGAPWARR